MTTAGCRWRWWLVPSPAWLSVRHRFLRLAYPAVRCALIATRISSRPRLTPAPAHHGSVLDRAPRDAVPRLSTAHDLIGERDGQRAE
jgi:hypothetical protein